MNVLGIKINDDSECKVKTGYYVHFISALCSNPMEKKEWETLRIRATKGNDVEEKVIY